MEDIHFSTDDSGLADGSELHTCDRRN